MSKNIDISVAIPLYNRRHLIAETLECIINQSYPVKEIVIVDDGSTDEPLDVISKYFPIVTYIKIENSGPAIARKTAIENCSSEWIALCDSDDLWKLNHISNFINALSLNPNFSYYFSNFNCTDSEISKFDQAPFNWMSTLGTNIDSNHIYITNLSLKSILNFQPIFQSCLIFKKSLYLNVGGIDPTVSRTLSEDLLLTLNFIITGNGLANKKTSVLIRKHENNFSADYIKCLEGELIILGKFIELIRNSDFEDIVLQNTMKRRKELFQQIYWYSSKEKLINLCLENPNLLLDFKLLGKFFYRIFFQ